MSVNPHGTPSTEGPRYAFGPFLLDLQRHVLLCDAIPVRLTPKAFELLRILVESRGRLVDKNTLMQRLWPKTFVEENSLTFNIHQVRRALGDDGREQRYIENVPRAGYRFRAPVTTVSDDTASPLDDPAPRLATDVVPAPGPSRHWSHPYWMAFLALLILIALTVFSVSARLGRRVLRPETTDVAGYAGKTSMPLRPRRSLAVLDLRNASGRPADSWLSAAVPEMLSTEFAAAGNIRTIPRESVARMQIDLSLANTGSLANDNLIRVRAHLGTDLVVVGSFTVLGESPNEQIRLDLRVQDTATTDILTAVAETGAATELFGLVAHAGGRLRDQLQSGEVSAVDAEGIGASLPSSPTARRLYIDGLTRLRRSEALAARDLFQKAAAAEPSFPIVHARLADVWSALGYDDNAQAEAKQAFDLSASLSQPQRLLVEANYRRMTRQWDLAVEISQRLSRFFPDDPEFALQLAEVQTVAGKPKDALSSLETFTQSTPLGDDARLSLAEAAAAYEIGDLRRLLQAAQKAASKGTAQHARHAVAYARLQEARAYGEYGRFKEAIDAATEARKTFEVLGDQAGTARALLDIANYLRASGDLLRRQMMYEQVRAVYHRIGYRKGEANALNDIAGVLEDFGDLPGAKRGYEESLAIRRAINDRRGVALSLNNIGDVFQVQGDLANARRLYEEALAGYRKADSRNGVALTLGEIGEILRLQGDLSRARTLTEEAVNVWREMGVRNFWAGGALCSLGDVLLAQGDVAGALKLCTEGLAMTNDSDSKLGATAIRLHIAGLWIEDGRAREAEPVIRGSRQQFRKDQQILAELQADTLLAKSLLVQGKLADAEQLAHDGEKLAAKTHSKMTTLEFVIVGARVDAAEGDHTQAVALLKTAMADANKFGCLPCQFEASLALGEVELRSGDLKAGRARLTALLREAEARGYRLVARKTRAALGGSS